MDTKRRNHNEGSIRERKDSRFEVRVTAGIDFETGKSKRISYYTKTKSEAIPDSPQQHSYPVIVTPCPNGFIFNPVDFEALSIEADNIQYGISCIQSAICQRIAGSYPPPPTPVDELVVNGGEFVVVVNV